MKECRYCEKKYGPMVECDCGANAVCRVCYGNNFRPRCPCGDGPDLMAPSFQERYEQAAEQKRRLR